MNLFHHLRMICQLSLIFWNVHILSLESPRVLRYAYLHPTHLPEANVCLHEVINLPTNRIKWNSLQEMNLETSLCIPCLRIRILATHLYSSIILQSLVCGLMNPIHYNMYESATLMSYQVCSSICNAYVCTLSISYASSATLMSYQVLAYVCPVSQLKRMKYYILDLNYSAIWCYI